ncbi:hypothetical protein ACF0H5_006186 [Mactra antiquata]
MKNVLLGGGRGFVGRHLTKLLKDQGYSVTILSRQTGKDQITWNDVKRNGIPDGCTAVVNVAGENILNPLKRFSDQKYVSEIWKSRVETTKLLADAITASNKFPEAFVCMSGVGYYPPSKTASYDENSSGGDDWIGRLAAEWEEAGKLSDNVNTRHVIIRSGVVLGKDGGMIQILKPIMKVFGGQKVGSGQQWLPWIHVEDMAGLITYSIQSDHVTGVLNGVSPDIINNETFTKTFAKSLKRFSFGFVPEWYIKGMFGPERAMVILEGQKVNPMRTLDVGYKYKYSTISEACKELAS